MKKISSIHQETRTNILLLTIGVSYLILTLPNAVIIALDTEIIVAYPVPVYFTISKALYLMNYAGGFSIIYCWWLSYKEGGYADVL